MLGLPVEHLSGLVVEPPVFVDRAGKLNIV